MAEDPVMSITVRTRTGWMTFAMRVANLLAHLHLRSLAAIWLWLLQPTFIVGLHVEGQCHHFGPFRWRKWDYRRAQIAVTLQFNCPWSRKGGD